MSDLLLKECAHCGGVAIIRDADVYSSEFIFIECTQCSNQTLIDMPEIVIAKWNSRVFPAWLREKVESVLNEDDVYEKYKDALHWVLSLKPDEDK